MQLEVGRQREGNATAAARNLAQLLEHQLEGLIAVELMLAELPAQGEVARLAEVWQEIAADQERALAANQQALRADVEGTPGPAQNKRKIVARRLQLHGQREISRRPAHGPHARRVEIEAQQRHGAI